MGDFLDFLFREFAASGGGRGCSGSSCGNAPRKPPFPSSPSLSLSAEDRGEEDNFINHRGVGGTTTEERGFPKYWLRGGGGGRSSKVAPSFSSVAGLDFLDLALPPSTAALVLYISEKSFRPVGDEGLVSLCTKQQHPVGGEVSDQRGFFSSKLSFPDLFPLGKWMYLLTDDEEQPLDGVRLEHWRVSRDVAAVLAGGAEVNVVKHNLALGRKVGLK